MFTDPKAFENVIRGSDGKPGKLQLQYILHEAIIEVNEAGITAAAATGEIYLF